MIAQKVPPIMNLLRSRSARSPDFGENSTLHGNRTERERKKNVEMDRNSGYDI